MGLGKLVAYRAGVEPQNYDDIYRLSFYNAGYNNYYFDNRALFTLRDNPDWDVAKS